MSGAFLSAPELARIPNPERHFAGIEIFDQWYHEFAGGAGHFLELWGGDVAVGFQEFNQPVFQPGDGIDMKIKIVLGFDNPAFFNQQEHDITGVMGIHIQYIGHIAKIGRLQSALLIKIQYLFANFRLVRAQGHPVIGKAHRVFLLHD